MRKTPSGIYEQTIEVSGDKLRMPRISDAFPMVFLSANTFYNSQSNAERFNALIQRNEEGVIISAVERVFPRVTNLVLGLEGDVNVVLASITGLQGKLPIGLLSAGVTKYLAILLAAATTRNGTVLLDEAENGFYYKNMPQLWCSIVELCRNTETQLLVTTHSIEFLKAILPSVRGHETDFTLVRTEMKNGEAKAELFSGRQFESALMQNIDVR